MRWWWWWCMATIGCPLLIAIWSTFRSPHHHPCLLRGRPRQRGSSNRSVVDTNNNKADKISSNKTSYNDDYQVLRRNEHGLPAIIMGDDLGHIGVFHNAKEAMAMLHNHEVVHENAKRSLLRIMTREGGEGGGGGDGAEFYVPGGSTNNTSDFSMGSNLVAKGKPQMSKDGSMHVRFQHEINGYLVEDAFLMVHTNPRGQIVAVNGEFVRNAAAAAAAAASDHLTTPVSSMMLDAPTARAMAMREAGINVSDIIVQEDQLSSQPTLAMVVDSNTGEACLAWKCIVEHSSGLNHHDDSKNNTMSSPSTSFQRDAIYADVHDGHLCARHPQIVGLASEGLYPRHYYDTPPALDGLLRPGDGPVIQTMACEPKSPSSPIYNERYCYLYSNATRPISPNDNDDYYYPDHEEEEEALCKAHNHALATYRYFWNNHGLWSFNGQGMPVVSFVLNREFAFDSAYWNGASVTFGDGLSEYNALSLAADVVAHEFTHGVTQYSSGLVYHGESGALNEAISDIFGALIDRQEGATGRDIWLVGENTARDGYIRDMADPASRRHFDYYPTRYQGPLDMGGVHWNSGIINLAFKLLVMGGTHPRQKTSVHVRGLMDIFQGNEDEAFQTAGDIFFCANNECLTPTSTFEDARFCTTIICGATGRPQDEEVVHCVQSAWFAVGVGSEPPSPPSTIHQSINALPEEESLLEQMGAGQPLPESLQPTAAPSTRLQRTTATPTFSPASALPNEAQPSNESASSSLPLSASPT